MSRERSVSSPARGAHRARRHWDVALGRLLGTGVVLLGLAYILALVLPKGIVPDELRLVLDAVPGLSLAVSGLACLAVVGSWGASGRRGEGGERE